MLPRDVFDQLGYKIVESVLTEAECSEVGSEVVESVGRSGGARNLMGFGWCVRIARKLRNHPVVASLLPIGGVAVQCTYFRKSVKANWLVPVHQDLSIPVRTRVEHPELKGWSTKQGQLYVQAPAMVLQSLVAVRVHIDNCSDSDGALRVLPGTHRMGRLEQSRVVEMANESEGDLCPVPQGGCLVMRPLLVHASSKASGSSERRVLHYVFGPGELPFGLRWRHAA